MNRGLLCHSESVALVCRGEEGTKLKGKALNLLIHLHAHAVHLQPSPILINYGSGLKKVILDPSG